MFSVLTQLHLLKELFKVYNEYSRLHEEKKMIPKTHIIFVNYVYSISVEFTGFYNVIHLMKILKMPGIT